MKVGWYANITAPKPPLVKMAEGNILGSFFAIEGYGIVNTTRYPLIQVILKWANMLICNDLAGLG